MTLDLFKLTLAHLTHFSEVVPIHDDGSSAGQPGVRCFVLFLLHNIWSPCCRHCLVAACAPGLTVSAPVTVQQTGPQQTFPISLPDSFISIRVLEALIRIAHGSVQPILRPHRPNFTSPASLHYQFLGGGARDTG